MHTNNKLPNRKMTNGMQRQLCDRFQPPPKFKGPLKTWGQMYNLK